MEKREIRLGLYRYMNGDWGVVSGTGTDIQGNELVVYKGMNSLKFKLIPIELFLEEMPENLRRNKYPNLPYKYMSYKELQEHAPELINH